MQSKGGIRDSFSCDCATGIREYMFPAHSRGPIMEFSRELEKLLGKRLNIMSRP